MANTYLPTGQAGSQITIHAVFAVKHRENFILKDFDVEYEDKYLFEFYE